MAKDAKTIQRLLYVLLLTALNVVGLIMVGVVFLSASNANGEGAPIESSFIGFLRQFSYVIIISFFFSLIALMLTRLFPNSVYRNNPFIKNIFWVQLGGMVGIFLLSFLYLWLKFDL
jgi:magnesium-transporting ATPase (P-type)